MRHSTLIPICVALAGALLAPPMTAALGKTHDPSKEQRKRVEQQAIRAAVKRGEVLPLPRILAVAHSRVAGDVVKVELEQEPWGIKYEVKILTPSGRVREVELNARTGAIVKIETD